MIYTCVILLTIWVFILSLFIIGLYKRYEETRLHCSRLERLYSKSMKRFSSDRDLTLTSVNVKTPSKSKKSYKIQPNNYFVPMKNR